MLVVFKNGILSPHCRSISLSPITLKRFVSFHQTCGWPLLCLDIPGCHFEDSHLLSELCKSGSVISTIRPVAIGICVGRENTCDDDKWKYFLSGSSNTFCEAKLKAHPTYVYSDLWLKFYTCLYYTWIEPGIMWIVDGETWNHVKIIWFQVWFPKQDSGNSYRIFNWTWVSLYNSPGLNPGKCLSSYLAMT